VSVLDAAAATFPPHGQLASALPEGGLAVSCHKLVEDGARAQILYVPALFRLDVRPIEDTLQVSTRSLHAAPTRWITAEAPFTDYGGSEEPAVVGFAFVVDAEPHPLAARISLASTIDRETGLTHFVAHAVVREVPSA
jgi:hypothetical protein